MGPHHSDQSIRPLDDLFASGGAMGALMRETDWSSTQLGPVETWPKSLQTMLGVVLGSRFPMLLWWGPDLLHLYNDAYRPILRDKHPASLAAPAAQVWAEVWDVAGPMARGVLAGGPATWTEDLQLFINSGAMAEETYFTFSYSPVPGDDGRVGGILNTVQETTEKVQSERQIRMLGELAARAANARSEQLALQVVAEVLSENELDVPFGLIYVSDEEADTARLVGVCGLSGYEGPARIANLPLSEATPASWPVAEVLRSGHELVVGGLAERFGPLPKGRWNASPERAILLPLSRAGQSTPYAALVLGISPHRAFDDRYLRFFRATATQVMTVISNARAYEAETKRAEALAEIDRAKTTFFSNMSHEFRTPLTLMLGPTEDALRTPEGALSGEALRMVHRNTLRLMRLVNALLDFSRIESGRTQATYRPSDLSAMTVYLTSAFRSAIEGAGLRFEVNCEPLPEPLYVDHGQWEKIVLNLLSNALKFTFDGAINVALCWCGDHVELVVRDTGTGIPEDELPHLFERFHQVREARSRTHEGSGIGLALVHDLVGLHGGSVHVSSRLGEGTTFTVSIPRGSAHLPEEQVRTEDAPRSAKGSMPFIDEALRWSRGSDARAGSTPTADQASTSARLLVVDDNADLREYMLSLLSEHYAVETANDGVLALDAARRNRPDLILSDVMMPRLDGFGLLRELRRSPTLRDVPLILLSARAGEEATVEGLEAGADDYLVKPFAARELLARVRTHLELGRQRSELARLNERLGSQNEELTRATQAKTDFLAMMSHELRTPLNAIIGFSEVLLDGKFGAVNERQTRYLGNVHDGGKHLLSLINDLLDLSKVEAGRLELAIEPWAPFGLVTEAIATLRQVADAKRVALELDGCEQPLKAILVDPLRMKQVLYNLLSNAIKFTPAEGRVSVTLAPQAERLRIMVRDTGPGIAPEDLERLFQRFSQLDNARRTGAGTGLGLALTKQLVELMGGSVGVESTLGSGSTFFVDLPVQQDESRPVAPIEAGPDGQPLALVVDDNAAARELLELSLQRAGYRVMLAHNGEEALVLARRHHPAVITLDVFLPGIDGWDVLRALRGDPATADIPVVLATISSDRSKAFGLGALEHLVKPIDHQGLLAALDRRSFTTKVKQRPVHILVIDDDPWHVELVRATLEPKGFKISAASTGHDGIAAACADSPDLLLLDLVLPDISGVQVAQTLRRSAATRDLPILLVTANELSAADRHRLNGDVEAILAKASLDVQTLHREIERVVRRSP